MLIYNFEGFKNIDYPFEWSKITDMCNDQLIVGSNLSFFAGNSFKFEFFNIYKIGDNLDFSGNVKKTLSI